nr:unnamed protein product [Spirometra erinaceieuropaei]
MALLEEAMKGKRLQRDILRDSHAMAPHFSPLLASLLNIDLHDNLMSNRPERRTALVARELARNNVDIVELGETRFSEQGQLEEVGAGYTFLWGGCPRAERRLVGAAFAIRNDIVGRLPCLPQGTNSRPMSFRQPLWECRRAYLITKTTKILKRWAEHFKGVVNRPSISGAVICRLPPVRPTLTLTSRSLSLHKTSRTVPQLSSGKAPGSDAAPAKIYKHGGSQLMDHPTALFQEMWRQGEVLQNFKDVKLVHLYKRKGNRQICDSHRGTPLLNIAEKTLAHPSQPPGPPSGTRSPPGKPVRLPPLS